jgi:hypothetical protein
MANKKITVKHYLNKRAKPKIIVREKYFPLYIQIIVSGKKAQIKSKINEHLKIYRSDVERITKNNELMHQFLMEGYISEKLLDDIKKNRLFPLYPLLMDEISVLTRIISLHQPFSNPDFSLNEFSEEYSKYTEEITKRIDNKIKELYIEELNNILLKTIDRDDQGNVFQLVDYLINYINWNNSFSNFYKISKQILPNEIQKIDELLNHELNIQIKAFMAYHEKVNLLKRFFEKRELGKISTLSYLDWLTDIRDFVYHEFEKNFGEQRALEYVLTLESLLKYDLRPIPTMGEVETLEIEDGDIDPDMEEEETEDQ